MLIDTEEYYCKHVLPLKGIYSGSHDVLKFWEIIDIVSEIVQDTDIPVVAMEG